MKNKSILFSILYFLLFIAGCTNTVSSQETPTATNLLPSAGKDEHSNPTQTPTPIKGIEFPSTPFVPTPSDIQTNYFLNALQDENCQPPCYLGILPGKTRFEDAHYKLLNTGARYVVMNIPHHLYDGAVMYKYNYVVRHYLPEGYISQKISLFIYDGYVFRVEVSLNSSIEGELFNNWTKYSISSLLNQYGVPDRIFVSSDKELNDVWLLYDETGIFIGNEKASKNENQICPGFEEENHTSSAYMLFYDPKSNALLTSSSEIDSITTFEFHETGMWFDYEWTSTDTVLGITSEQFYRHITSELSPCFERVEP